MQKTGRRLGKVVREIADGLRPESEGGIRVCWQDDQDAPAPGPGMIVLEWGDEGDYFAPDIEGPNWLEKRRQQFGS